MNRIITPPPGYYTRCLREEYVAICQQNLCAAMILSQHEYWHQHNLVHRQKAQQENQTAQRGGQAATQNTSLWSAISHTDMQEQLFGLFGEKKIGEAYKLLVSLGFLDTRHNPKQSWDRKPQYLFMLENVQAAVDQLPRRHVNEPAEIEEAPQASRHSAESTPQNCGEDTSKLRSRSVQIAETMPQHRGDSVKNLPQNIKRTSKRAASPPEVSLTLLEEKEKPLPTNGFRLFDQKLSEATTPGARAIQEHKRKKLAAAQKGLQT